MRPENSDQNGKSDVFAGLESCYKQRINIVSSAPRLLLGELPLSAGAGLREGR